MVMIMTLKVAFAGFRHGHILGLYALAAKHPGLEIVAACEEDESTRKNLAANPDVKVTHDNFDRMLAEVPCDIVAVGDYFARRGSLLIKALQQGKHVIADKPICTDIAELNEIAKLAEAGKLKVGCQLDLRSNTVMCGARKLIKSGAIGEIHAIQFGGQHPLNLNSRPAWYFEDGKHGGTINDIAIHGIDIIPWLTGLEFTEVVAARTWNAFAAPYPNFNDAGQFMAKMNNGCGVMGDVSYFAPNSCGFKLPYYWRFTAWGINGVLEFGCNEPMLKLSESGSSGISMIAPPMVAGPNYLEQFLDDINGKPVELDTAKVIESARNTLLTQQAADKNQYSIKL